MYCSMSGSEVSEFRKWWHHLGDYVVLFCPKRSSRRFWGRPIHHTKVKCRLCNPPSFYVITSWCSMFLFYTSGTWCRLSCLMSPFVTVLHNFCHPSWRCMSCFCHQLALYILCYVNIWRTYSNLGTWGVRCFPPFLVSPEMQEFWQNSDVTFSYKPRLKAQ